MKKTAFIINNQMTKQKIGQLIESLMVMLGAVKLKTY